MNNKTNRLLAMLLTVVMCFATLAPTMVFAEETTQREIIAIEDFEDKAMNQSGSTSAYGTGNVFFFGNSAGSTHEFVTEGENTFLRYTDRAYGDVIDIRMYYDSQESLREKLKQDFIVSFRIKALFPSLGFNFAFLGATADDQDPSTGKNYAVDHQVMFTRSRLQAQNGTSTHTKELHESQLVEGKWALVELAFHYDPKATSVNGQTGAVTSYDIYFNGEKVAENYAMSKNFHSLDYFRMSAVNGAFEIDDVTVALGSESLKDIRSFDDVSGRTFFYTEKDEVTDYAYSMAVVGDIQNITRFASADKELGTLYSWLIDNKESKKIEFVIQDGDITDKNTAAEWEIASKHINRLNGVIPQLVVRGNHDMTKNSDGTLDYSLFEQYFSTDDYMSQFDVENGNGGFYENSARNSWRKLEIAGHKYLFVTLDYGASDAELNWAGEIIAANPDYKVIIVTHAYLFYDGSTIDAGDHGSPLNEYEDNTGEDMWNKLVRKYENITMVISGHEPCDEVLVEQVEGDNGNIVTQMLVNFQDVDAFWGSTGMVTMLYFSEDGNCVDVETYSTIKEAFFMEENQFSFKLDPDTIYSNDFSNASDVPGTVGGAVFGQQALNCSVRDGVLNAQADGSKTDIYLSLRPFNDAALADTEYNRTLKLSFKLKIDQLAALGSTYCRDLNGVAKEDQVNTRYMTLDGKGDIRIPDGGTDYGDVVVGEWNKFEVLFHYNDVSQKYESYTVIHNDHNLGTFEFASPYAKIDEFLLARYATGYQLDDLYLGFDRSTALYDVDFTEESFGNVAPLGSNGCTEGVRVMDKYDSDKTKLKNDILTITKDASTSKAYFDAYFSTDSVKYLYDMDVTFSMRFRPGNGSATNDFMTVAGYNSSSGKVAGVSLLKYTNGAISINGGASSKKISQYEFTTIDVRFHYDFKNDCYSLAELYVNGNYVESVAITKGALTNIGYFRMWQCFTAGATFEVDSISVSTGLKTTYKGESVTEFIGYQATAADDSGNYNVRLIGVMNSESVESYKNVGFKVSVSFADNGVTVDLPDEDGVCTSVYESVLASAGIETTYTAATLGGKGIFALNCLNLSTGYGDATFTVTTYYTLADAEKAVEERTFEFTVTSDDLPKGGVN